ncbi:MAG: hypothetical protein NTZ50_01525 [Chloroflexi bacterium]|nr:hypothetical protein [Chloroflexota bacterium]
MKNLAARLRSAECGFSTTVQGLFYVVLLWWCFGLVYDLGGAAWLSARLRSAAMSAAQDGAKELDTAAFYRTDALQLNYDAARARAQAVFAQQMTGLDSAIDVSVQSGVLRDFVVVNARVRAPMRVMSVFGLHDLTLTTSFAAEAVPGIAIEYQ